MVSDRSISREELDQRVAVLKRFRELLVSQREKFNSYLGLLERQKDDIEASNLDALVSHVEIEQTIVADIHTFQRVIDPLEDMYRSAYRVEEMPSDIPQIQYTIEELRKEVLSRNEENRSLLKQRMAMLRQELDGVRRPFRKTNSVYGGQGGVTTMIDLHG